MVNWSDLDDMVAKAVEENLDGERVRIVTGFVADDQVGSLRDGDGRASVLSLKYRL